MPGLNLRRARVVAVDGQDGGAQFVRVAVGEKVEKAVNYLALGRAVAPGQEVLLNTTAVDLGLGSGGYHFILPAQARRSPGWGHQMKLRYTPLQVQVDCAEEQGSPWHDLFKTPHGLAGIPVLAAELHSMVPPLALAVRTLAPRARIAYVCTDGGALPLAFSRNIRALRELGAIVAVITAGHSFGGDLETVNVFTGLQAAAKVAGADIIIAAMGPGIAGTGTVYGFSGLEQGFVLQAARALGGQPVLVPRIGFCDPRRRHHGLSHHSITIVSRAYSGPVWVPMPLLPRPCLAVLAKQAASLPRRCRVRWLDGSYIGGIARQEEKLFCSMGRTFRENPHFFLALGAAARLAAELYRSKPPPLRIAIK